MRYDKHGLQLSSGHDSRCTWFQACFWCVLIQFAWDRAPMCGAPHAMLSIRVDGLIFKYQATAEHLEVNVSVKAPRGGNYVQPASVSG
jgi:hypothetical protein